MIFRDYAQAVNDRLSVLFSAMNCHPHLTESMLYSVNAGGKRLRPALCMAANALVGGDADECIDLACAIELIHTYSLVHDDLPAMDDDDLRRGKPTNHVMFGEGIAILAGDGLLSFAYETMLKNALKHQNNLHLHVAAIREVSLGSGTGGMLTGQTHDMMLSQKTATLADLANLHDKKTGALIACSLTSGAVLGGADDDTVEALRTYGMHVGRAFQIIDDILDVEGDAAVLGKTPGKDAAADKLTYPKLVGLDASRRLATEETESAVAAISALRYDTEAFHQFAKSLLNRTR